ncbi:MAG TPA: hypothetical protein VMT63_07540 [Bacteroidales bacterium]|nr:hypothetical protein [Bacteroidales bacterium]
MKQLIFSLLALLAVQSICAQRAFSGLSPGQSKPVHEHQGIFLSMSLGPVFGKISDATSSYDMTFSGPGAKFDVKLGGVIGKNLILHATLLSEIIAGPKIAISNGTSGKANDNLNIGESMLGGGVTYYLAPSNIFFSGSVGLGGYSIIDNTNKANNVSTQQGFSCQLKAGKEWWISPRWAIGIAFTYSKTKLTNEPGGGVSEKLNSNRFGILLNATLN